MGEAFPLSPLQAHIRDRGEGAPLTVSGIASITGPLDRARLDRAIEAVVAEHEILRTTITDVDGMPAQEIGDASVLEVHVDDHDGETLLAITAPAVCADPTGIGELIVAIARHYAGETPDDEGPMQYADVAAWQLDLLEDESDDTGRRFWARRALPADDPRTPYDPTSANRAFPALATDDDPANTEAVGQLASELGVEPFDVWLTAWAAVLARVVEPDRQGEIVVGVEHVGRDLDELRGAIGPLTRQLPHAFGAHGDRPFRDAVRDVHRARVDAEKWAPYFRWSPTSDAERHGCAFAFTVVDVPEPIEADGVRFAIEHLGGTVDRNRFRLSLLRMGADVQSWILRGGDTDDDKADDDALRLLDAWGALLAGALADPSTPLDRLPLLSDDEYQRLVVDFNETDADYPRVCIHEQIEAQVDATPDAVAIRAGDRAIPYADLDAAANRLAHHLQSLGAKPNALVAIALDRSPEMVIAILGVLKSGAAYVPIDPDYPEDRIRFVLEQTGATIVLTREAYAGFFAGAEHVVCFDRDADALAACSADRPTAAVTPTDLCYVIYTSGSTGRPKGVMITHEGLVISNQARIAFFGEPVGTFLLLSPLAFDSSVVGIYWTLLTGGTLLLVPKAAQQTPDRLAQTVADEGVTHLLTLPSFYALVLEHGTAESLASLRCAIVAGEACPKKLIEQHRTMLPDAGMFSEYGATETTVWASGTDCLTQTLNFAALGTPIENAQMYVVDENLVPLPVGVPGEVCFGGPAIAPGYLNRPDLTEERFVPDPFREGGRLYRSGDLARHVATGEIEFLGRIDNQVKIRGFRVELEEIDAVLTQHEDLREAIVDARAASDDGVSKRLVGYVAPLPGKTPSIDALKSFLAETLPDYMVPSQWVVLAELPKTPNGKVDRRALPDPEHAIGEGFEAPANDAERTLATIWSALLGVDPIGRHDNFFELGGDSILSIQVVARAKQAGLAITARDVFEHQTIAALAECAGGTVAPTTAEQGAVTGDVPLTPIQHWFFERELPEPHHANMSLLFCANEAIDVDALRRAGQAVLDHHDALRMRYAHSDGAWHQTIADAETVVVETVDGADTETIESRAAEVQASLDIADGPLLRFVVFNATTPEPRVLIAVHHLVFDGVSWRILLEDLEAAYRGGALRPKSTSFKAWAERLGAFAHGEADGTIDLDAEHDHWLAPIGDVATLPTDRDAPAEDHTVGTQHILSRTLDAAATDALLHDVPRAYRTRIDDILVTALLRTLAEWTGSNRIHLDLEGHGREEIVDGVDLSRTIGWFTTTYPAVLDLPAGDNAGDAIESVKAQLGAIPNRGIGYGLLRYLRDDDTARALAEQPAASINYNYLGQFDQVMAEWLRPAPESAGPDFSPRQPRSHVLEACGLVVDGCLRMDWTYSDRLHDEATIARLADAFTRHLRALIVHCTGSGRIVGADAADLGWTDADVDAVTRAVTAAHGGTTDRVEDVYPVSPLQQGLLFHALAEPDHDTYYEGFTCTLRGPVDVDALRGAWQAVVDRYPILRTGFVWEGVRRPVQVVEKQVAVVVRELDWRDVPPSERADRLAAFNRAERRDRFDLTRAPLMRVTLIRHDDDTHTFVWGFHHLIMDGWSMFIVLEEAFQNYDALAAGESIARPRPPAYRDYIREVARRDTTDAERFWRERLAGFTAPTPLVVDHEPTAPPAQGLRQRKLSADATARLEAFAREHRLTMNAIVQGTWGLLLHRYAGTDDVVFGATSSGRTSGLAGVEAMVGLFINTLPVRMRIDPERPVVEWLRDTQVEQAEALEHDAVSLGEVQSWSDVAPGQPMFETIFIFENYKKDTPIEAMSDALSIDDVDWDESTNFAIRAHAMPGEQIELSLLYAMERLDAATVDRIAGHWIALLEQVAADPARAIADLRIVAGDERDALLATARATKSFDTTGRAIHHRFEAHVDARPDATAAVCGDASLTYAELEAAANRLAHRLRSLGVERGARVGLATDRSLDTVVGILGILKSGAAYVPIDPTYPADRVQFMIEDSDVHAMVTQRAFAAQVPHGRTIVLDADDLSAEPTTRIDTGVGDDDLCYIIYTSGSTGRPKGVMLPHRAPIRLLEATHHWFGFDETDVWSMFHSYAFDVSVFELWGALAHGGAIVVIPYEVSRTPDDFHRVLRDRGVTVLSQTPSAFYQIDRVDEQRGAPDELAALRWVIFAGEALDFARLASWFDRHGDEQPQLVNMYGITETTVHTTFRRVTADDVASGRRGRIGVQIPDLDLHVLDERMEPAPIGVVGELYVGGPGVANGYLNRAELTAERFLPDPFRGGDARLYKSGDLARRTDDGDLEYVGRNDHQVQLRGFRVELGEIESALATHGAIREAVVLAREDTPGDVRLVGYAIATGDARPTMTDLRAHLLTTLPDYMVPVAVVWLDAFPLTGNGKLDRRALPSPDLGAAVDADAYVAPRTPSETTLAAIWADVLGIERVGVDDNFFELGGDSIRTIQIVSRATEAGLTLTPMQLFRHQTVAELARLADDAASAALPLTPAQAVARPGAARAMLLDVDGVDATTLERAVRALLDAHEGLRVRIADEGVTIASTPGDVVVRRLDAPDVDGLRAELDPAAGDLVRAALVDGGVLLVVHDTGADDASWPLVVADLRRAIAGEPLEPAPFSAWARTLADVDAPALPEPCDHTDACMRPLDPTDADALFGDANDAYRTAPLDLLAAAVARAHDAALAIELTADDLRSLDGSSAPARTSGAFAPRIAVGFDAPNDDLAAHVKATKERRRAPDDIAPNADVALAALDIPGVTRVWATTAAPIAITATREALHATFGPTAIDRPAAERLLAATADALRDVLAHCRDPQAGGLTPSDFPDAGLDQGQLDDLLGRL